MSSVMEKNCPYALQKNTNGVDRYRCPTTDASNITSVTATTCTQSTVLFLYDVLNEITSII